MILSEWLSGLLSSSIPEEEKDLCRQDEQEDATRPTLPSSLIVGEIASYLDREMNLRLMSSSKHLKQELEAVGLPWPIQSEWKIRTEKIWLLGEVFLASSNDKIICGAQDGRLRMWSRSGKFTCIESTHESGFLSVVTIPTMSRCVTVGLDGKAIVWDLADTVPRNDHEFSMGEDIISFQSAYSYQFGASIDAKGDIKVWDLASKNIHKPTHQLATKTRPSRQQTSPVAISSDGRFVCFRKKLDTLAFWDTYSGNVEITKSIGAPISHVVFTSDSQTVALACGNEIQLRKAHHAWNEQATRLFGHGESVCSLFYHDNVLISGALDGEIRVWNSEGDCSQIVEDRIFPISSACLSPDGTTIIAGYHDGTIRLRARI
jgi:WD40 repeat protein